MAYPVAISGRWGIDYSNKRIFHSGLDQSTVDRTVDLYSWLQDTFDEAGAMDDQVPMSAQTPNAFTMINGWFVDDQSTKFLDDGAIQTNNWIGNILMANYAVSGATQFDPADGKTVGGDLGKTIANEYGHSGIVLFVDSGRTPQKVFIRPDEYGVDHFDQAATFHVPDGVASGMYMDPATSGESLWTNLFTLGTIQSPWGGIHIFQSGMNIQDAGDEYTWGGGERWWTSGHIDILLKVKEADLSIDGGTVTPFLREYTDLYDHFPIDLSAGGRQAAPLATGDDLNNQTVPATVSGYGDSPGNILVMFVNVLGAHNGVTGGPFTEFESVTWAGGAGYWVADNSSGDDDEITLGNVTGTLPTSGLTLTGQTSTAFVSLVANADYHNWTVKQFNQQSETPPYNVIVECSGRTLAQTYEYLKYVTSSGNVFQSYRVDSADSTGPYDGIIIEDGEEYIAAHEDYVPNKAAPYGSFAGGTLFGARGVWVQNMHNDDIQAFQLIDASGVTQTPPNEVSISVGNTAATDSVFVALASGTAAVPYKQQYTMTAQGASSSTVIINETIPSDTPSTGFVRVVDVSTSTEQRYPYSSWASSTFTLDAVTTDRAYTTNDTAYVPYIDTIAAGETTSVNVIYAANRTLLARVRRYQGIGDSILPFETTSTLNTGGFSATTIRNPDTIVV
ncbi:MAG: hypothetical protein ACXAEN_18600 [Candidatus Thorarchaeota archaeon]|jgi:hypothetical protein